MKLSAFCALIPSKDGGHLLAIDTAGDAIWGHHTQPVPSPSEQACRRHPVSVVMTGDKESREITRCNVQLQLLVHMARGRSSVFFYVQQRCDCPDTSEMAVAVWMFVMLLRK